MLTLKKTEKSCDFFVLNDKLNEVNFSQNLNLNTIECSLREVI